MLEVAAGRLRGGLVRGFFAFGGAVDIVEGGTAAGVLSDYYAGQKVRRGSCLPGSSAE